jgi:hypothetical protein
MLATIGKNLEGLNEQNSAQLPSAWNTLYFLSLLGLPRLLKHIATGTVHPGLTLREARELWRKQNGAPCVVKATLPRLRQRTKQFTRFILMTLPDSSAEARQLLLHDLALLLHEILVLGSETIGAVTSTAGPQREWLNNATGRPVPGPIAPLNSAAAPTTCVPLDPQTC